AARQELYEPRLAFLVRSRGTLDDVDSSRRELYGDEIVWMRVKGLAAAWREDDMHHSRVGVVDDRLARDAGRRRCRRRRSRRRPVRLDAHCDELNRARPRVDRRMRRFLRDEPYESRIA